MKKPNRKIEAIYNRQGFLHIAGIDEAGKGAWAGPVVAAAVVLPQKVRLSQLNDSKMMSKHDREQMFDLIKIKALDYGVGVVDNTIIDEIGLAEAHRLAIRTAVSGLSSVADLLLVDGVGIKMLGVKSVCIVKGDQKVSCISAASVLAKVTRDRIMSDYHQQFPLYGFNKHKGYGTQVHQNALNQHGVCPLHRLSYAPLKGYVQNKLF